MGTVLPYPTQGEVLKRLEDAWSRSRLTPRAKNFLTRFLGWRRCPLFSQMDRRRMERWRPAGIVA
jgi:hypothetical protein